MHQLTDQALAAVLGRLQGSDVGSVLRVCRAWCELVQGDPGLRAAAEKVAAERKGRVFRIDRSRGDRYLSYSGYDSYSYDEYDVWLDLVI
jgi:hypothetical protein